MYCLIRKKRIDRGWSYKYIAQKIGITQEAVRLIETGKRKPSYPVLLKLEDLFEMNHRELFEETPADGTTELDEALILKPVSNRRREVKK